MDDLNDMLSDDSSSRESLESLDFSTLLASSVHDIKNSLNMLLTSLDDMTEHHAAADSQTRQGYSVLRGEASRINNSLIYLLGLYRLQKKQLNLNIAEIYVSDFLEEQIASQQLLFDVRNVRVELDCDRDETAYFDESLIAGVINNILVNCSKYTRDHILVRSERDGLNQVIEIRDNGKGYPAHILEHMHNDNRGIDFSTGSTNLGLYFAAQIAQLHRNKDRQGRIELSNLPEGGGCFRLILP